uniref:TAFII28-like protein domain-containing protein n=1 Tax=Tetradesmus obliquus TaxID=3088 RepID=A0A383VP07_TETOB|eukprot:jgi/Sobl393_1/13954/SZX66901.1
MDYGYYDDDGLAGLGGERKHAAAAAAAAAAACQLECAALARHSLCDDGLGGLGGSYAPPPATYEAPDMFADDALMMGMPNDEEQQQQQQQQQQQPGDDAGLGDEADPELASALDALDAPYGQETTQGTGSQVDSRSRAASEGWGSGDDEATEDEIVDGDEDMAEQQPEEQQEPEDPAAAEAQRQNAWYKECFDAMTEAQRNRLEAYIRSNLQKKTMKKVLQELTGLTLNDRLVIAISSITKMFVGELVETARQIAAREGHSGALLPSHIRQAHAALSADGRVPHGGSRPLRLR